MAEEFLADLPPTQITGLGAILFRASGHTFMLYQAGYDYQLYDPLTDTSQQVLSWLSSAGEPTINKSIDVTAAGRIIIRFGRPYGLDVSAAMDIDAVVASSNYTQTMQPIGLPESVLPVQLSLLSRNAAGMILYRASLDDPEGATPLFYWLDLQRQVLNDYCFDATNAFAEISADGKFVAFTRHHLPSQAPVPKSILVVNLETGYIAQVEGYRFIGWGQAAD
jgi:hypothetical protein